MLKPKKSKSTGYAGGIKQYDAVALLHDMPSKKLLAGQVGTVVEILDHAVYEVEFANKKGETITTAALPEKDLLLLHYEMDFAA